MKKLEYLTEPELRTYLNMVANAVRYTAHVSEIEDPLFAILILNDPKLAQYVSNVDRGCMIKALREMADRLERNQDLSR